MIKNIFNFFISLFFYKAEEMKIEKDHLTINQYSRPGRIRRETLAIVMHWTGSPNQDENTVKHFFEIICPRDKHYSSAHFIIGQTGRILEVIPTNEVAYHCGTNKKDPDSGKVYTDEARSRFGTYTNPTSSPNNCTIGIELCPINEDGEFSRQTLESATLLVRQLLEEYGLTPEDVTTHHEIVGWKDCPRFWTNNREPYHYWRNSL